MGNLAIISLMIFRNRKEEKQSPSYKTCNMPGTAPKITTDYQ
jgi:hypothetical protein